MNHAASIILPYKGIMPKIHPAAFIAPGAVIIGDVEIAEDASIWPGCVLRGDVNVIRIGARTNIQDGTIIHVAAEGQGTFVGSDVTVGHCVLLHACTIADRVLVGMKSAVMDNAKMESETLLASGALLTPGKVVPSGQVWAGSPAKFWREMKPTDTSEITKRADQYVKLARDYK